MRAVDYILEQDINTTSVYDIEMQQLIAEMEVYTAIIGECEKQNMILEYADDASVFLEDGEDAADNDGDKKKKGLFKKKEKNDNKGDAAKKKWYQSVMDWFAKIGTFIVNIFTKMNYGRMIEVVKSNPNKKWSIPTYMFDLEKALAACIEDYDNLYLIMIGQYSAGEITDVERRIKERGADIEAKTNDENAKEEAISGERMLELLNKLKQLHESDKITKTKKILKSIHTKKKELDYAVQSNYKTINSCCVSLYKQFNELNDWTIKMMRKFVKKGKKDGGDE